MAAVIFDQLLDVIKVPQQRGLVLGDSLFGSLVCAIIESLSERPIHKRGSPLLRLYGSELEKVVNIEENILLDSFILSNDEAEIKLRFSLALGEGYLEQEGPVVLF